MMEITGDGEGAVVITDDHLCETVRQYARETIIGSPNAKNKPIYYGQARECDKSVKEFWMYVDTLEKLVQSTTTSDEEGEN